MAACGACSESAAVVFTTSLDNDSASEDALTQRLLEGIRSHPCVYDIRRMDYRDTERQNNAWDAIRKQCGLATGAASQDSTTEELLNTMCGTASVSPLPSEDSFDQEQADQADQ
ncbi:hypothetical protein HPB49_005921 [Dermacentor silvarum]|uniref:Uncharacterized protein n=1 Tax=Dermacentor silvarum TaxID=543639 RepID=A0ACB8DVK4_DERSI|nr:hypothetical protein HPB49_005921 [Dermacentor silvarum]